DRFVCAANKPCGLLVHGDGTARDTLTARVQSWAVREARDKGWEQVPVPQALQRLDVGTSGVVLFSLTQEFQPIFDALVASHDLSKCYLAVVRGKMDQRPQRICAPLARDRHDARRMRVGATGKHAATRVMCLDCKRGTSLVACLLETGRRHQIRVHLASQGHPIVGDELYGGGSRGRALMLHACQESFAHPVTGEHLTLSAPWPDRFSSLYSPREINWSILETAFS
ncbi:MAG: RluA family pseudouridine synthase, partial [Coriobacteriales bacterium]|nr:RluA family pseudouridine synthase [Coriobacteriales bacterium]